MHGLLASIGVGLAGGFASGLLGVSPGGGLVVFSVLLLGAEQHAAQGISLVAQIPPTSLAAIRRYWEKGSRSPLRWLVILAIGFVAGGVVGAYAASFVSDKVLQWTYVAYLVLLDVMLILRRERKEADEADAPSPHLPWAALATIGLVAGLSSGFMGIGGGLATVVGLSAVMRVPQHQAQMVSLVLSLIPTTLPSAWVYFQQGWSSPWTVLAGVIVGLIVGNDIGARLANRVDRSVLHVMMVVFVSVMALYMAWKALS
jgi:uncharacterized membrane protein YfcA